MDKEKDPRHGHRKRMRETFMKAKGDDLPDYQIVEMLLFYVLPRVDTRVLAHELMIRFESLSALFDASPEEISSVKGVPENFAVLLKLIKTCSDRYKYEKVKLSDYVDIPDIGSLLINYYAGFKMETLTMISVDSSGQYIAFDVVGNGRGDSVTASVRSIIEIAIKRGANGVILAHNHPSGIAIPSKNDVETTKEVKSILNKVGVQLIDHIVIENHDYVSMAQSAEFAHIFNII